MRIFILLLRRLREPLRRCRIVQVSPETASVHFPDAVFHIAVGLLPLHSLKRGERLCVPQIGLLRISIHANTVRQHPSQIVHGESVAGKGFLREEAIRSFQISGRIVITIQKSLRLLVAAAPLHDRRDCVSRFRRILALWSIL